MNKILTAIGNSNLNEQLKKTENYEMLGKDIRTDNELIEYLERVDDIDYLILCSNIINNYSIDEFIEKIRKMRKNTNIVFFNIGNKKSNLKENETLKLYSSLEIDLTLLEKILQKKIKKRLPKLSSKVISVSGVAGIGKSTFSTFLAKNVENLKVLLIDFDLDESSIRTILKIKRQNQNTNSAEEKIIKLTDNLDVLCHLDYVWKDKKNIDYLKIQELINEFRYKYNFIIIDTSSNLENGYTRNVFYNSDEIIFLVEPNILGIKKSKNMLEVLENDWKIQDEKIKLITNKAGMYQISDNILQEIFPDLELIGKVKYNDVYNLMINKDVCKKDIKKEYKKIFDKIISQ